MQRLGVRPRCGSRRRRPIDLEQDDARHDEEEQAITEFPGELARGAACSSTRGRRAAAVEQAAGTELTQDFFAQRRLSDSAPDAGGAALPDQQHALGARADRYGAHARAFGGRGR